jgi:hypothetical protein
MAKTTLKELAKIEQHVRQFCGPISFIKSLQKAPGNVTNNGSFGLVDTGRKKLLVTCHHVWTGFQEERSRNPDLKICICLDRAFWFTPDKPVWGDENLDIVTFDIDPHLGGCSQRKFYPWHQDTVPVIEKGDVLFFIGFPGYLRRESGGCVTFGRSPFWMKVHSVDGQHVLCDISRLNVKTSPEQFGGISGCPCYLVREYKSIQLAGFATCIFFEQYLHFTLARRLDSGDIIDAMPQVELP